MEIVNLGDNELASVHLAATQREELVKLLKQYINVFAWCYDDMRRLSTNINSHNLSIN